MRLPCEKHVSARRVERGQAAAHWCWGGTPPHKLVCHRRCACWVLARVRVLPPPHLTSRLPQRSHATRSAAFNPCILACICVRMHVLAQMQLSRLQRGRVHACKCFISWPRAGAGRATTVALLVLLPGVVASVAVAIHAPATRPNEMRIMFKRASPAPCSCAIVTHTQPSAHAAAAAARTRRAPRGGIMTRKTAN